jgi:hypothetical protein
MAGPIHSALNHTHHVASGRTSLKLKRPNVTFRVFGASHLNPPLSDQCDDAGVGSSFQVRGFYVYYDDQKMHPNIEQWDVTRLLISRNKPHLDKTTSLKFWEVLDGHTKKTHRDLKL